MVEHLANLLESLSRPGGLVTGFTQFEYSLCAKWPEMLEQIAPGLIRAAVLRDAATTGGIGQFAIIQTWRPPVGLEVSPIKVREIGGIEGVTAFSRASKGGLIGMMAVSASLDYSI